MFLLILKRLLRDSFENEKINKLLFELYGLNGRDFDCGMVMVLLLNKSGLSEGLEDIFSVFPAIPLMRSTFSRYFKKRICMPVIKILSR